MNLTAVTACRWVGLAAVAGAVSMQPAHAGTDSVLRLDLIGGGGFETDPFLMGGGGRGSAVVDAEVRPVLTLSDDRGSATFEGYYRRKEYLKNYAGTDGFGIVTRSDYRPSERVRLTGSVVFDDAVLDAQSLFGSSTTSPGAPGTGGTLPTPSTGTTGAPPGDVGLLGLRQRRSQLLADLGLTIRTGQRDDWLLGFSGVRASYPGTTIASDYSSYGGSAGFTRLLNERHTLGVTVSAQNTQYKNVAGSARVISPQVVYRLRLPRNWTVNLSGGASFVSGNAAVTLGQSTSFAFQAEACSNGERVRACLSAARTVAPSGTSGVGPVTTGRVLYLYRFNRGSDLALEANLSSVDRRSTTALTRSERYYTASATYSRSLTDRLQGVAGALYERRAGGSSASRSGASFRIGLSYSLGKRG